MTVFTVTTAIRGMIGDGNWMAGEATGTPLAAKLFMRVTDECG
jgi:hypothetical protein